MAAATQITTGQVTLVTNTATQIVAARPGRKYLLLNYSGTVYFGSNNSVTNTTGYQLLPSGSTFNPVQTQDAVWAYGPASTVEYCEFHD